MRRYNLFGLLLALAGVGLLLNAMGLWRMPHGVSIWNIVWPLVIILSGLAHVTTMRRWSPWGLLVTCVGVYFLLTNIRLIPRLSAQVLLPLGLIVVGLAIFLPKGVAFRRRSVTAGESADGFVTSNVLFGSDERSLSGKVFTGANIAVSFGGSKLNLSGFESCADPCNVSVSVSFGGCEIYVPCDTKVRTDDLFCALGGVEYKGMPPADARYVMNISGSVSFGGLEITYPVAIPRREFV